MTRFPAANGDLRCCRAVGNDWGGHPDAEDET
jgi:hypothetical protein